jgi:hypothetical protein
MVESRYENALKWIVSFTMWVTFTKAIGKALLSQLALYARSQTSGLCGVSPFSHVGHVQLRFTDPPRLVRFRRKADPELEPDESSVVEGITKSRFRFVPTQTVSGEAQQKIFEPAATVLTRWWRTIITEPYTFALHVHYLAFHYQIGITPDLCRYWLAGVFRVRRGDVVDRDTTAVDVESALHVRSMLDVEKPC